VASSHIVDNLHVVTRTSQSLELVKDLPHLNDASLYLMDTCATLVATLTALPAAAPEFLAGSNNHLPRALATVHASVRPHIHRVAAVMPDSPVRTAVLKRNETLRVLATKAVQLLLQHGLLEGRQFEAAGPSTSAAADDNAHCLGELVMHHLMELQVCCPPESGLSPARTMVVHQRAAHPCLAGAPDALSRVDAFRSAVHDAVPAQ
jgi:hypothetical protein